MLGQKLIQAGLLDEAQLEKALGHQKEFGGSLADSLVALKQVEERAILEVLARDSGLEWMTCEAVERFQPDLALIERVPVRFAESIVACPLRLDETGRLWLLVARPLSPEASAELLGYTQATQLNPVLGRRGVVLAAIRRHFYGDVAALKVVDEPLPLPAARRGAGAQEQAAAEAERDAEPDDEQSSEVAANEPTREVLHVVSENLASIERENARLRAGYGFARELVGVQDIEQLLQRSLGLLLDLFQPLSASVVLQGEDGRPVASETRWLADRKGPQDATIALAGARIVISQGKSLRVPDVHRDRRFSVDEALAARGQRALLGVPLPVKEGVAGALVLEASDETSFSSPDVELLALIGAQVGATLEAVLQHTQQAQEVALAKRFGPAFPVDWVDKYIKRAVSPPLGPERVEATVLVAELRSPLEWLRQCKPHEALDALEAFQAVASRELAAFQGAVQLLLDGSVLGVFGAPCRSEDHAAQAVSAATKLAQHGEELGKRIGWGLAIGLSTGPLVAGAPTRSGPMGFRVIGPIVGQAFGLCAAAPTGEVLAHPSTQSKSGRFFSWREAEGLERELPRLQGFFLRR